MERLNDVGGMTRDDGRLRNVLKDNPQWHVRVREPIDLLCRSACEACSLPQELKAASSCCGGTLPGDAHAGHGHQEAEEGDGRRARRHCQRVRDQSAEARSRRKISRIAGRLRLRVCVWICRVLFSGPGNACLSGVSFWPRTHVWSQAR